MVDRKLVNVKQVAFSLSIEVNFYICFCCRDNFYKSYSTYLITTFILLIAVTGLVSAYHVQKVFSIVGSFYMGSFVILLMYLNLPIPISVLFPSAVIFSIVFEVGTIVIFLVAFFLAVFLLLHFYFKIGFYCKQLIN